jgi:hypothetical protein
MDWINVAQDRDCNEPSGSIKCWKVAQLAALQEGLISMELVIEDVIKICHYPEERRSLCF